MFKHWAALVKILIDNFISGVIYEGWMLCGLEMKGFVIDLMYFFLSQIPRVNLSSSASSEEDAILSQIRTSRSKPRSWCPSPVSGHSLGTATLPRSQSEEFSFNRAVLESWRRTPDLATSPCSN